MLEEPHAQAAPELRLLESQRAAIRANIIMHNMVIVYTLQYSHLAGTYLYMCTP